MALESGAILDGTVVKLLRYGVIVSLPENQSGLVHISEIADSYVHEVSDFFREGDPVKVKVLGKRDEGRWELSAKQAEPRQPLADAPPREAGPAPRSSSGGSSHGGSGHGGGHGGGGGGGFDRPRPERSSGNTFEDRLADFLKESNRKISEMKRDRDGRRRGRK